MLAKTKAPTNIRVVCLGFQKVVSVTGREIYPLAFHRFVRLWPEAADGVVRAKLPFAERLILQRPLYFDAVEKLRSAGFGENKSSREWREGEKCSKKRRQTALSFTVFGCQKDEVTRL